MKKFLFLIILHSAFYILNSFCFAQNKNIDSLLALIKTDKADTNKVTHLNKLSREFINISSLDSALTYSNLSLQLATFIMNEGGNLIVKKVAQKKIADSYSNIGMIHNDQGDYPEALEYYFKALKIAEELGDKKKISGTLINIGIVYMYQGDYPKTLDYTFKGLKIAKEAGYKQWQENALGNIGLVYWDQGDNPKALDYYLQALKMAEELGDKNGIARHLGNIGTVYDAQGEYTRALEYYFKGLNMKTELGDKSGRANTLRNIGVLYGEIKEFKKAENYLKQSMAINDSVGAINELKMDEEAFSYLYEKAGQYKQALVHYKKAIAIKDTLFSQENKKQLVRKEMNFEFDKKEAATKATHDKEMAVAEAEKKKQQFILLLVSCFLILVFLFAGFVFRSLRITRKQKNIIELQKNEVSQQKEIVEKQKEKIVDSITYAQRIQQSILMEESEIQNYLPECFIYFQPKDIVSGDFYWCSKIDDKIILAAVDCTGHGVPGAFMSMIGNTLLNQIVNEKHITKPSEILRQLNLGVYEALHQQKDGALSPDGMDIALCAIDYKNNEIQYAGAQNPLYVISENKIEVVKGDIHGIGGGGLLAKLFDPVKIEYNNHIIRIKKDMCIYLFSDGYSDQFGGTGNKKFGTQKFKGLLLGMQQMSMQKQKTNLSFAHEKWKGSTAQIDDILVIGIRI